MLLCCRLNSATKMLERCESGVLRGLVRRCSATQKRAAKKKWPSKWCTYAKLWQSQSACVGSDTQRTQVGTRSLKEQDDTWKVKD